MSRRPNYSLGLQSPRVTKSIVALAVLVDACKNIVTLTVLVEASKSIVTLAGLVSASKSFVTPTVLVEATKRMLAEWSKIMKFWLIELEKYYFLSDH